MTIDRWISERADDNFIIEYDGKIIYDARKTRYEPAGYIMQSLITEIYTWNGTTILSI